LKSDVETINAKADKCEVEREGLKVECAVMRSKIETLEVKLERINVNGTDYSHKKQS
jgi:transcriptional antiterminator Rof (Rho-off)